MTIDEAIQKARDNENSFKNNHKLNLTLKKRSPLHHHISRVISFMFVKHGINTLSA